MKSRVRRAQGGARGSSYTHAHTIVHSTSTFIGGPNQHNEDDNNDDIERAQQVAQLRGTLLATGRIAGSTERFPTAPFNTSASTSEGVSDSSGGKALPWDDIERAQQVAQLRDALLATGRIAGSTERFPTAPFNTSASTSEGVSDSSGGKAVPWDDIERAQQVAQLRGALLATGRIAGSTERFPTAPFNTSASTSVSTTESMFELNTIVGVDVGVVGSSGAASPRIFSLGARYSIEKSQVIEADWRSGEESGKKSHHWRHRTDDAGFSVSASARAGAGVTSTGRQSQHDQHSHPDTTAQCWTRVSSISTAAPIDTGIGTSTGIRTGTVIAGGGGEGGDGGEGSVAVGVEGARAGGSTQIDTASTRTVTLRDSNLAAAADASSPAAPVAWLTGEGYHRRYPSRVSIPSGSVQSVVSELTTPNGGP